MLIGEEVIIGLKKTLEFGIVLMFGHGGKEVEKEKDVSFRIPPLTEEDIESMIKEIKFYKMLEQKTIDIEKLKNILDKTTKLAKKYPNILELDINPLIINSKEAKIADARIVFEE
jgi:hypothetical protein